MFDLTSLWPWIALALLGGFHGLNPAMGWLFAVSHGLQERNLRAVVTALGPISLGHAAAIAGIAIPFGLMQVVVPREALLILGGSVLIGYALYKVATRFRHPRWVGMRIRPAELAGWSALMAAAHGAGLMLIPALAHLTSASQPAAMAAGPHHHHHPSTEPADSLAVAAGAVALHTLAMLAVMALLAIVVYQWVGVDILRKAWINLDLLWIGSLFVAGGITLGLGVVALM